jgi:Flp pilus assembly protein TadD
LNASVLQEAQNHRGETMRKALTVSFLLVLMTATTLFAIGEARLTGKVTDQAGAPLTNVTITVTSASQAKNFRTTAKTDKSGNFTIFLLDGTIPYKFSFAKDGFVGYEETIKLKLVPEKNTREVKLGPAGAAPAAAGAPPAADPAIAAYNEGAQLANEGKDAEAIAKIEQAVALKPDLTAGLIALAKLYARADDWPKAINAAVKALEIDAENPELLTLAAEGFEKTGDKSKAAEYRKRAPANPAILFNQAATLINAGKDKEAEPLLKQAIGADPAFARAYYELGMIYARSGKNADAKTNLEKYIELEPKGNDVATAKEMLNYIK